MANTKVTGDVIANGTISTVHIADDAITAAKLDSTATGITFADLAVDTDTLYVDSANNRVGIGTSSPSYKLGLSNSNTLTAVYQQFTNGTTGTTSSDGTVMGIDADGDFLINNQEAKEIKLYTSDTQRLTIQSGGNVGIGTTNPSTILDVRNSINIGGSGQDSNIYFQQNTSNQARINYYTDNSMYFDNWNGGYYFRTTSSFTPRVTILNGGNVGIGATSPTTGKLVINGDNYSISNSGQSLGGLDLTTNSNPGTGGYSAGISFGSTFSGRAAISGVQSNTSSDGDRQGLAFFTHASGTGSADSAEAMRLTSDGNLGIGTTSPTSKLDIAWGGYQTSGYALTFGADIGNLSTRTNNTTKYGIITGVPYTTTNPNIELFTYYSNNTSNALGIGGQGNTDLDGVNSIAFLTATNQTSPGQIRMTIDSSGKVGIGTTSPVASLDTRGSGATSNPAISGTSVSTGTRFRIGSSSNATAVLDFGISTGGKSWLQATDRTNLSTGYNFLINPNGGNVGIGTTNPQYAKLQVNDSIRIDDDAAGAGSDTHLFAPNLYLGSTNGGATFQYNGSYGLDLWQYSTGGSWGQTVRFTRDGNVGIGTTSPQSKLHVNGGGINLEQGGQLTERTTGIESSAIQNTWYTVHTFNQYELTLFFLLVGFEDDLGDSNNRTAIFVDSGSSSYGLGFTPTRLSGNLSIQAQRSGQALQIRFTHTAGGSYRQLRWSLITVTGN